MQRVQGHVSARATAEMQPQPAVLLQIVMLPQKWHCAQRFAMFVRARKLAVDLGGGVQCTH